MKEVTQHRSGTQITAGATPEEELLAEHAVMAVVLSAMEAEVASMQGGRVLRRAFWADVIDFNGNFVHLCHRVKEEGHLIPILTAHGLVPEDQLAVVHREHGKASELTLGIRDGVEEDDWEKVLRLVVLYVHLLRAHMHEEDGLFALTRELPAAGREQLRAAFAQVEAQALAQTGRAHFVDVVRRIAEAAGVELDAAVRTQ